MKRVVLILIIAFLAFISVKAQNKEKPADFSSVEILPQFPGGQSNFTKYIYSSLKYPTDARKIKGKVIVSFIVEKDGSLSNIRVLKGLGGTYDKEAVRIIKESPIWQPAIQGDKAVRFAYTAPINFQ